MIRPYQNGQVELIRSAIVSLRNARESLKQANAPEATEAVRKALKSVEGAERHALHRQRRTEKATA